MGSNSFGRLFKITTWGESHGVSIGVVIDGCPAGVRISEEKIQEALLKRATGQTPFTSPRKEGDHALILSGILQGVSTGAPIAIEIKNRDADSLPYQTIQKFYRPGHANFTYLKKYGLCEEKGGGRSSARETAVRVAAGSIAAQFLEQSGIFLASHLKQAGTVVSSIKPTYETIFQESQKNLLHWADPATYPKVEALLQSLINEGDSTGGVVETISSSLPAGLGDPVYQKLEAELAYAMLSIPASKGFEIGEGFASSSMKGSEHNDLFIIEEEEIKTATNHAGGTLGGISTGMPLIFRVAFKPTSSIKKPMQTLTKDNNIETMQIPQSARHDPCVAIRAVPVVEAMAAIVLANALLIQRTVKL